MAKRSEQAGAPGLLRGRPRQGLSPRPVRRGMHKTSPPEPSWGSRRPRREQSSKSIKRKEAECFTCGKGERAQGFSLGWVTGRGEEVGRGVSRTDHSAAPALEAADSLEATVRRGPLLPGRRASSETQRGSASRPSELRVPDGRSVSAPAERGLSLVPSEPLLNHKHSFPMRYSFVWLVSPKLALTEGQLCPGAVPGFVQRQ